MKKISAVTLLDVLPESILLDPKLKASAEALSAQLQSITAATREVLHLPRLDELSGTVLDYIAEALHIDFYEPLYLTEDEKRNLIRESIAWHRMKGTPAAVEKIAHDAFRDAEIVEWFDYPEGDGEPYHFKIRSHGYKQTPDGFETYIRMINAAKNVRSWVDNYEVDLTTRIEPVHANVGLAEAIVGLKTIELAKPHNVKGTVYTGGAIAEFGGKQISLATPIIFNGNRHQFYAAQALTKGGAIFINADLRDLPTYSNLIESPLVELALADIALARDGRIKIPVEVYERFQRADLFAMAAQHVSGTKVYDLHRPENPVAKTYAGQILTKSGVLEISTTTKRSSSEIARVGVGQVFGRTGTIKIDSSTKSTLADNELFFVERGDIYHGQILSKQGTVRVDKPYSHFKDANLVTIRVGQGLIRSGEIRIGFHPYDFDPEGFPKYGDWLRLYFDFPSGKFRTLTIKNPREDVTKSDIKKVGDIARDYKILLNSDGEYTTGSTRALLIKQSVLKLI